MTISSLIHPSVRGFFSHPPPSALFAPGARWERAAGEVRPDLERDGAPPAGASRERREPGAGPEDREAALGCQGAAEPDVPHRAGLAGDQRGEGQSQGHRLTPAPVLPSGCRRW